MTRKNKDRLVSSIMICGTVLGMASTNGNALAQSNNAKQINGQTKQTNNNGDQSKSDAVNKAINQADNATKDNDQKGSQSANGQKNTDNNHATNDSNDKNGNSKQVTDSNKKPAQSNNDKSNAKGQNDQKSDPGNTSDISINYSYKGDTKATVKTVGKVGQNIDLNDKMPNELRDKYTVSNDGYKVRFPTKASVPVQLEAKQKSNDRQKNDQQSQDTKPANDKQKRDDNAKQAVKKATSDYFDTDDQNESTDNGKNGDLSDKSIVGPGWGNDALSNDSNDAKGKNSTNNKNDKNKVDKNDQQDKKQAVHHYTQTTTPVPKQYRTPLPSKQYFKAHPRTNVVNPMIRPETAPQIQTSNDYDSQVPMDSSDEPTRDLKDVKPFKDFSKEVLRYKPYLDKVCDHYHMKSHETLLLAIMQVESGGRGRDVMQSSESVGLKAGSLSPQQSIEQGTRYLSKIVKKAKAMDRAEHDNKNMNPKDYHYYANDNRMLAQAYNFGGNFMDYVAKQKHGYSTNVAQKYSKDVVAPRLGNSNGATYTYDNPISKMYHKTYLYKNGGNFFYGDMTEQYAVGGYMHTILDHLIKYAGQKYVFGGKDPKEGFDCSGLTSYGFHLLHVLLPSYTVSQWHDTKAVKGGLNNSKPGDLVFFKGTYGGPHFISHVGFIVDPHTMFAADSDGVGFHSLDESYWKQHFAGVRRIPQAHRLNVQAAKRLNGQVKSAIKALK